MRFSAASQNISRTLDKAAPRDAALPAQAATPNILFAQNSFQSLFGRMEIVGVVDVLL